jgi:hypothetical protein
MMQVDDSDLTQDHIEFLQEWARALEITVAELLGRIVIACSEGELYVELAPELRPHADN